MTSDLEQNENVGAAGAPPIAKKKASKKKSVGMAELKRQLADARAKLKEKDEENDVLKELVDTQQEILENAASGVGPDEQIANVHVSVLSSRWVKNVDKANPEDPDYLLDGTDTDTAAGSILTIPQDDDEVLYEIKVGKKKAYMVDIEDAGKHGEYWADELTVKPYMAKDNPVNIDSFFDAHDQTIAQNATREMKSTGDARESLDKAIHEEPENVFQVVGDPSKAAMLAFMEQELEVMVHDTNNVADIPIPCFINDGRTQYFIRGKAQTVKRKFVEILARCKTTTFSNEMYQDAAGADAYRYPSHTALMFPFSVRYDPHPRGQDWLRAVLNEEQ